jgi:hypothetical protein
MVSYYYYYYYYYYNNSLSESEYSVLVKSDARR